MIGKRLKTTTKIAVTPTVGVVCVGVAVNMLSGCTNKLNGKRKAGDRQIRKP